MLIGNRMFEVKPTGKRGHMANRSCRNANKAIADSALESFAFKPNSQKY